MSLAANYISIAIAFIGLLACFMSVAESYLIIASTLISIADSFSEGFLAINSVFGSVISTQLGLNRTAMDLNTMLGNVLSIASIHLVTAGKCSGYCKVHFRM